MKSILTLIFTFSSIHLYAAKIDCRGLSECLSEYGKLTGKKHLTFEKISEKNPKSFVFEGDEKELEEVFTFFLNQNGYTRISPTDTSKYYVISTRDIRYNPVQSFKENEVNNIPKTYDYFMLSVPLKNKLLANDITRSLRPFMSRYGRIISNDLTGMVTLQETGVNIHRLYQHVKQNDIPFSREEKKEYFKRRKYEKELRIKEMKYSKRK